MKNCNTCIWYIYPLPTDNRLQTRPIPTVITDLRYCALGGCNTDGDRYEEKKKP